MSIVKSSQYAHIRLTVTDIEQSKRFYDDVFGWPVAIDESAKAAQPGIKESPENFYGGVVYQLPSGALFGLRPVAASGDKFDSQRTGLDHLSFVVDSRDDLVEAAKEFKQRQIEHGEIKDLTDAGIAILSFSDPDGMHCELTAKL